MPANPKNAVTDAAGTRRRLQALVAVGHPVAVLAGRLGMPRRTLAGGPMAAPAVTAAMARKVARLYDELWDVVPERAGLCSPQSANLARRYAERNGWPVPMAWDDDVIDDPEAGPAAGWKRRDTTRLPPVAGRVEDALEMFGHGLPLAAVADRLDMTARAVDRMLHRHGEHVADRIAS